MIASHREVCEEAIDQCVCHFGTCGVIGRRLDGAAVDPADVKKIRCAPCTALQDILAEARTSREVLESPLLQHVPLALEDENALDKHFTKLKKLWRGKSTCPYHPTARSKVLSSAPTRVPSREPIMEPLPGSNFENAQVAHATPEIAAQNAASVDENNRVKESETESGMVDIADDAVNIINTGVDNTDIAVDTANVDNNSVTDNVDDASNVNNASNASDAGNHGDHTNAAETDTQPKMCGIETSCWAAAKKTEPVVARRAVPTPTTKITPKAREAAKQLSSMRGFLTG